MKPAMRFDCFDEHCRTVVIGYGNRLDGIRCPRCNGPILPKPYVSNRAFYVREKILERSLNNCRDLTPEQVDIILSIGDEYRAK